MYHRHTRLKLKYRRSIVLFLCLTLIIVVVTNYKLYYDYQTNKQAKADKILLDRVDQKMRIVYNKIVADLGEPAYKSFEKTCTYPNVKGDRGKPSCGPRPFILYKLEDENTENYIQAIKDVVNSSTITSITYESRHYAAASNNPWMVYGADLTPIEGVECTLEVQRDKTTYFYGTDYSRYINTPNALGVATTCSKLERKPVYRVDS